VTEPELTWESTWQNREHDLSAFDGDVLVGRVYRVFREPDPAHWRWVFHVTIGDRVFTSAGIADDGQAACQQVEADYRRFRRKIRTG